MKKILAIAICGLMLAGCGTAPEATTAESEVEAVIETPEATPEPTETPKATPTPLPDPTDTPTPEPTPEVSEWISDGDGYWMEQYYLHNGAYIENTSGPIKYTVDSFGFSRLVVDDPDLAEYYEVNVDEECTIFSMAVTIENTSDEDVIFPGYPTITTNTKQQVEQHFDSDYFDSDFHGQVIQEATLIFILDKTLANELTQVNVNIDPPYSADSYEDLGSKIQFTINFTDYENEVS